MPNALVLSEEQKKQVEQYISHCFHWTLSQYELAWWPEADINKVPVFIALPKILDAHSPFFIVMKDGRILTQAEDNAFLKIIHEFYPKITAADAEYLVKLALHFGNPPNPVGELYVQSRDDFNMPRKNPAPTYQARKGVHIIQFFTYNYDLMRMSDCELRIIADKVDFLVKPLQKKKK